MKMIFIEDNGTFTNKNFYLNVDLISMVDFCSIGSKKAVRVYLSNQNDNSNYVLLDYHCFEVLLKPYFDKNY